MSDRGKALKRTKKNDHFSTVSFYNVTLPVTLWFLDKGKRKTDPIRNSASSNGASRKDKILFIDARNIYHQIDRAHRDWSEEQIQQITDIVRSYRGEKDAKKYKDVKGLCKVATLDEVRASGYSLNPGRYVGTANNGLVSDADFEKTVRGLNAKFQKLTDEAHDLEKKIADNFKKLFWFTSYVYHTIHSYKNIKLALKYNKYEQKK